MGTINEALEMIFKKYREVYGEDSTMEEGDVMPCVFNDAIITVEMLNGQKKINISAGEYFKFDFDLNLVEKGVKNE